MTTLSESTLPRVPVPDALASALIGARQQIESAKTMEARGVELRDRFIVEASEAGGSLREIAALVGLTHAGVRDILRRRQG